MHTIDPNPEFIIFGGDAYPNTGINPADYKEVVYNVTHLFKQYFPNIPVIYTLGNHDCFPAHNVRPKSLWLANMVDEPLRDILNDS